jgi:hypothetical protein
MATRSKACCATVMPRMVADSPAASGSSARVTRRVSFLIWRMCFSVMALPMQATTLREPY